MKEIKKDPFKEYLKESEPTKKDLGYSWDTAIGLQKVDGLETSSYLKDIALKNISGEITFDQVKNLIESYYLQNDEYESTTEEADKVAVNIVKILSDNSFVFSPAQYLNIHKLIFYDVFSFAGEIRNYNITKKEWVLNGDTVIYASASLLKETLNYDFQAEKEFDYSGLTKSEFVSHIARFIANLWQIHVFGEGNTRTIAVFLIKYLRKFGYNVTNDIFASNAWYFRNALVRANYSNVEKGIFQTTEYLEMFLKNLIFNEKNILKNRYLHIDFCKKVDIQSKKVDIEGLNLSSSTMKKISILYKNLYKLDYFGRKEVIKELKMSPSGASKFILKLIELKIIIPVLNHGKGKYRFNIHRI